MLDNDIEEPREGRDSRKYRAIDEDIRSIVATGKEREECCLSDCVRIT